MIIRYSRKRPPSMSSSNRRSALSALALASLRTRCSVSTLSSTNSRPGWPASCRTVSSPRRYTNARKWSMSAFTPVTRLASAPTWGWPDSHAAIPAAVATSPPASARPVATESGREPGHCARHGCRRADILGWAHSYENGLSGTTIGNEWSRRDHLYQIKKACRISHAQ